MDYNDIQELLDCLPEDRTLYRYCRDHYAVQLLQLVADRHQTIASLKTSPFAKLLDKPNVRSLIRSCGNGRLNTDELSHYWQDPGATWLLTTGMWGSKSGRYSQTSRAGFNLVLRMNFNHQHDQLFRDAIHPKEDCAFNGGGHPKLDRGDRAYFRETLAWARLDVDLDNNEVLVEEIQSDWVRNVTSLDRRTNRSKTDESAIEGYQFSTTARQARRYVQFAKPLMKDWSQAMLAATIDFVRRELGVTKIWYHTWETGACLKRIDRKHGPPISLYTRLPKQFCFERADELPGFLSDKRTLKRLRRNKVAPSFYKLEL